jgi:hypothetical protein
VRAVPCVLNTPDARDVELRKLCLLHAHDVDVTECAQERIERAVAERAANTVLIGARARRVRAPFAQVFKPAQTNVKGAERGSRRRRRRRRWDVLVTFGARERIGSVRVYVNEADVARHGDVRSRVDD